MINISLARDQISVPNNTISLTPIKTQKRIYRHQKTSMLYNLFPSDLPCGEIFRGNIALRKSDKSANCHAATELQGKKTDMRMKPVLVEQQSSGTYQGHGTRQLPQNAMSRVSQQVFRLFGTQNRLRHVCNKQINGRKLHPTVCRAVDIQTKWGLPNPKRRKAIAEGLENSVW